MSDRAPCNNCGSVAEPRFIPDPSERTGGKLECFDCQRWIKWVAKPENAAKKRRPNQHLDLVASFGVDYCELCLRSRSELKRVKNTTLEAHHVMEFKDGGSNARDNIWIVCTSCHTLIHHERTYHGHSAVQKNGERI